MEQLISSTPVNGYEARRIFQAEFNKVVSVEVSKADVEVIDYTIRQTLLLLSHDTPSEKAFIYNIWQIWIKKIEPKTLQLKGRYVLKMNISEADFLLKYTEWLQEFSGLALDHYTDMLFMEITGIIHQQLI